MCPNSFMLPAFRWTTQILITLHISKIFVFFSISSCHLPLSSLSSPWCLLPFVQFQLEHQKFLGIISIRKEVDWHHWKYGQNYISISVNTGANDIGDVIAITHPKQWKKKHDVTCYKIFCVRIMIFIFECSVFSSFRQHWIIKKNDGNQKNGLFHLTLTIAVASILDELN